MLHLGRFSHREREGQFRSFVRKIHAAKEASLVGTSFLLPWNGVAGNEFVATSPGGLFNLNNYVSGGFDLYTMAILEKAKERRTIRAFQRKRIPAPTLKKIVNVARFAPTSRNKQPLEFLIIDEPNLEKKVFQASSWAGYLDWEPSEEQRPPAYIVVLVNREIMDSGYEYDVGLAGGYIGLAAAEQNLGSCLLGSAEGAVIRELCNLPPNRIVDLVIALGYPAQEVSLEEAGESIEYWLDEQGVMHVPKRGLEDILYYNTFREPSGG
ncbi:MAG: nitroreductase family protein [Candidatus Bipolaricaulota bacterium]